MRSEPGNINCWQWL